jgi:hypothetical protein
MAHASTLMRTWRRQAGDIALDDFESTTGFGDLGNFHTGHDFSLKT